VDRELADVVADFKSRFSFGLADAFAGALACSAFGNPQSAFPHAGDPEFKVVEMEIKINWLK
jgi:hypothetical protein